MKDKTPLNPLMMTIKEWYRFLLEKNVTMRELDEEGRSELIPCKVEMREPNVFWAESYRICRLRGLAPDDKSFLFRLIHTLLPSKERIFHLTSQGSSLCWCNSGETEDYSHLFYGCTKNAEAGESLLRCIQSYDRSLSQEGSLRLELTADDPFLLPSTILLATGLELIWENRKLKKPTSVLLMRAELEMAISIRRRSRVRIIREAANIMQNMINNFFTVVVVVDN